MLLESHVVAKLDVLRLHLKVVYELRLLHVVHLDQSAVLLLHYDDFLVDLGQPDLSSLVLLLLDELVQLRELGLVPILAEVILVRLSAAPYGGSGCRFAQGFGGSCNRWCRGRGSSLGRRSAQSGLKRNRRGRNSGLRCPSAGFACSACRELAGNWLGW